MIESPSTQDRPPARPERAPAPFPAEGPIRLLLLAGHTLLRTSLAHYLARDGGFRVAGECGASGEALAILTREPVDVVLLGLAPGNPCGIDFIVAARAAGFHGRFLLVAGTADATVLAAAFHAGAAGIFLMSEPPARLVHAIRLVADGAVWADPNVIRTLAGHFTDARAGDGRRTSGSVDEHEQEVLMGVLAGLTNRRIADIIGRSEGTVKGMLQRLFAKAGVRTRSQLVRAALEGWLPAASTRVVP